MNTEIYDDVFLSKIKPDSTAYEVWFKESAIFGQEGFASGLTGFGGKIDKYGHAEFDSLTLRRFLEVPELRYNRVEIQLGDKWNAPGAGVIESVEQTDEWTGVITLKLEEGEYGAVSMGDLCMGIYHSEKTDENAENDEDDGRGNRKFAGFYTVYFEVTNILDAQNKKFGYKLRPVDEYWNMVFHPCAQMNFVAYGNKTNVDRQTSCYSTRTYTRYLVKQNTWD
nr:MAG TPA: tail protein [Crassvirales sp.]DAL80272.1 MAG TPA: tail protein [Caudoviricetes sp.]